MSENNISATELNNNLKNRLIIDVRESNEYKAEHILNAINIPLSKINYEEIKIIAMEKILFYIANQVKGH